GRVERGRRDAAGSDCRRPQRRAPEGRRRDVACDGRHAPARLQALIPLSIPDPLVRLIEEFQRLPGIGAKGAQRLAFHILKSPREYADRLVEAVRDVKERVTYCSVCHNITDVDPCAYCTSDARDRHIICVVEEPQNVTAVERTREYKGRY